MCAASFREWNIVIEVKSMSLISLLRFARGTVTFTVKGAFAERFLNLLSRNEIPVFHTRCTPEGYTAQTTVKHYRRIRPFVRKTHVRVRVVQRNGLPFWVQRYRRRVGLLVGIGLFCLCVGLSGQFVWSIEVNGNQTVSDDAILQSLEEMGLHRGSWKKNLDVQKMAIRLRQEYHQVGWAAVNLVGSVAEVEISERNEGEEEVQDTEPCNIVAARGGQIVQMEVYDGEGLRKKGETVKKGDLLVSGVVSSKKGKTILRHASAKVVAEYGMSKTVSIPMEQTVQVPVGEVKNYRYLNLFGKRFPLFLSGGNFLSQREERFERVFVRPVRLCGMVLPLDLTVRQSIGMQTQTVALSEEKAEYFAMQQLEEWEAQHPEYQVQRRLLRKTQKGRTLVIEASYTIWEDIARQEPILIDGR